jgi:hypothetical protein
LNCHAAKTGMNTEQTELSRTVANAGCLLREQGGVATSVQRRCPNVAHKPLESDKNTSKTAGVGVAENPRHD